jgi:hypothetical protein
MSLTFSNHGLMGVVAGAGLCTCAQMAMGFVAPGKHASLRATTSSTEKLAQAAQSSQQSSFSATFLASSAGVACIGAAAAASRTRRNKDTHVRVQALPKILEGTGGPFPENVWDPAGLTNGKTEEELLYYRAAELKHGRICMLIFLHWIHLSSGYYWMSDDQATLQLLQKNPMKAIEVLPPAGTAQIFFTIMILEWLTTFVIKPPKEAPWDLIGWQPILRDTEGEDWMNARRQEVNNGRLAMMAVVGLVSAQLYTGENPLPLDVTPDIQTIWVDLFPRIAYQVTEIYPGQGSVLPSIGVNA